MKRGIPRKNQTIPDSIQIGPWQQVIGQFESLHQFGGTPKDWTEKQF
jgi:hypothetical protein